LGFLAARMRGVGLDHADQAPARRERVVDHHQVARLENVERQLSARQQERAFERKHRNDLRKVGGPEITCVHRHRGSPDPPPPDCAIKNLAGSGEQDG
jgi:hypothetical protein